MSDRPQSSERLRPGNPPGRPQRCPFVVHCPAGRYALCRCARSASYPYCDGTHRDSDQRPLKVEIATDRTVAWCCCGRTASAPFCDGSHASG